MKNILSTLKYCYCLLHIFILYIYIYFLLTQLTHLILSGRAEKARKVLETGRLILPDDASILEALRKLNAGRTDLFVKAYQTAALLTPLGILCNYYLQWIDAPI